MSRLDLHRDALAQSHQQAYKRSDTNHWPAKKDTKSGGLDGGVSPLFNWSLPQKIQQQCDAASQARQAEKRRRAQADDSPLRNNRHVFRLPVQRLF